MNLIRPDESETLNDQGSQYELNIINKADNNCISFDTVKIIMLKNKHNIPLTEIQEKYFNIINKIKNNDQLLENDLNFIIFEIQDEEVSERLLQSGSFFESDILELFKTSNMTIKKILLENLILLDSDFNNARISFFKELSYNLKKNDLKSKYMDDCMPNF